MIWGSTRRHNIHHERFKTICKVKASKAACKKDKKNQGCYGLDIKDNPTVLEMLPLSKVLDSIPLYLAEHISLSAKDKSGATKDAVPTSQNSLQLPRWGQNKCCDQIILIFNSTAVFISIYIIKPQNNLQL